MTSEPTRPIPTLDRELRSPDIDPTGLPSWDRLNAAWDLAEARSIGSISWIRHALDTCDRLLSDRDALNVDRPGQAGTAGPGTLDARAGSAVRMLRWNPAVAANLALGGLDDAQRAGRGDLVVILASSAALALDQLGLRHRSEHFAQRAFTVGSALIERIPPGPTRTMVAYRCAIAVDLLLRHLVNTPRRPGGPDLALRAAVLVEQARRLRVPAEPADPAAKDLLNALLPRPDTAIGAAPAEPGVVDDLDLASCAATVTGADRAWWWGIRATENTLWVTSVSAGTASVNRVGADHVHLRLAGIEAALPLAIPEDEPLKTPGPSGKPILQLPEKRIRRRRIEGRYGEPSDGPDTHLASLVPDDLIGAHDRRRRVVDVAVSVPSVLHHLPLADIGLADGRALLDIARPVVAVHLDPPAGPQPSTTSAGPGRTAVVTGTGLNAEIAPYVAAIRGDRPDSSTPSHDQPSSIEPMSIGDLRGELEDHDVTLAVVVSHVEEPGSLSALDRNHSTTQAAREGFRLSDGLFDSDLVDSLSRVPPCVVLAGCRTTGATGGGTDDRVGLAPSFLRAGARWVISTLWPVDANEIGPFLVALIDRLRTQPDQPAEALRQAQLAFLHPGTGINRSPGSSQDHEDPPRHAWLPWVCMAAI